MAEVAVSMPVSLRPSNVKLKRGTDESMSLTWGMPADALWESNPARVTIQDLEYVFQASKNMSSSVTQERGSDTHVTADHIWVRDLGTSPQSHTQDYDRNAYHPLTLDRYLNYVTASVIFGNGVGATGGSGIFNSIARGTVTYTFQNPKDPVWGEPTYSSDTGKVSVTLTAAEDVKEYERYDTMYCISRQDNFTST